MVTRSTEADLLDSPPLRSREISLAMGTTEMQVKVLKKMRLSDNRRSRDSLHRFVSYLLWEIFREVDAKTPRLGMLLTL